MLAPARAHSRLKPEKRDVAAFMVSAPGGERVVCISHISNRGRG